VTKVYDISDIILLWCHYDSITTQSQLSLSS
jgi:hypothetical protein